LPDLMTLDCLAVQGLMTILPLGLSSAQRVTTFARLPTLAAQLRQETSWALPILSMGMSGDYAEAIQAGSTQIRVGRTLFGERVAGNTELKPPKPLS